MQTSNPYREFADWRLRTFAGRARESVRFFRSSLNHSVVWMLVIRGYYDNNPPTVGECIDIGLCSRLTTRKLIADAVSLGYLEVQSDGGDQRKRNVHPTELTLREYVAMVRGYMDMCDAFCPPLRVIRPETARQTEDASMLAELHF